jgi:hypothetical protein
MPHDKPIKSDAATAMRRTNHFGQHPDNADKTGSKRQK